MAFELAVWWPHLDQCSVRNYSMSSCAAARSQLDVARRLACNVRGMSTSWRCDPQPWICQVCATTAISYLIIVYDQPVWSLVLQFMKAIGRLFFHHQLIAIIHPTSSISWTVDLIRHSASEGYQISHIGYLELQVFGISAQSPEQAFRFGSAPFLCLKILWEWDVVLWQLFEQFVARIAIHAFLSKLPKGSHPIFRGNCQNVGEGNHDQIWATLSVASYSCPVGLVEDTTKRMGCFSFCSFKSISIIL